MANVFIGGIGSARRKNPPTSNQYYGRLNKRYDKRAGELLSNGFVWDKGKTAWILDENYFTRRNPFTGEFVMHASDRAFKDRLKRVIGAR
jgi:hypothetical protein